jgi:excisionase family DNA binding protein
VADSVMLTRQEVADKLGVSKQWLIRNAEQGPDFYKLPGGTIRYRETDLATWLKQRKVGS